MLATKKLRALAVIVCGCVISMSSTLAAVTAEVDRVSVDLNESFLLEISFDTDAEPDLTVLETGFYVGQTSKTSNTSIYNKQIQRSMTWQVSLMPKSTGEQEIPPITVGNEKSAAIKITVNEPRNEPPGEADVFVVSEVEHTETYVQAQILYRIKVYRAVATRQPALREPSITGAEVLAELAGDEKSYDAVLNGKAYNVVERVIALYPQESGEISISPSRFEARVLRDGRITGRKVFVSDAHTINVLPVPPPPSDYPDAIWLPARDVQLSEDWSREPDRVNAGEPVTRHVTISALGQIETQIPAIEPPSIDGLNIYADKPELSRIVEANGIRGIRKDQYAIIGVSGGAIEIPRLEVPWWNIDEGAWRVATLPARTMNIRAVDGPAPDEPVAEPVSQARSAEPGADEPAMPSIMPDGFWQRASQLLAAAWLLTILGWWWSSRNRKREVREPEPPPVYKRQAKFVKAARKAALSGDTAAVRSAVLEWGHLQWPDSGPRSIGEIARRVSSPLSEELRKLSLASYGPGDRDWDGTALAQAFRSPVVLENAADADRKNPLPPLMPPAA